MSKETTRTYWITQYGREEADRLVSEWFPDPPPPPPPPPVTHRDAIAAVTARRQDVVTLDRRDRDERQAVTVNYAAAAAAKEAREAENARVRVALDAIPPLRPGASEREMVERAMAVKLALEGCV